MTDNETDDAGADRDAREEFRGWPADGLVFLAELERDNSRRFWTENADRYRVALREPTRALAAALTTEFGPLRVFRPHVDRRFRPNADPYRTDTGATVAGPGGTPYAVVLSARGLAVQIGYRRFDREQLRRYRAAVEGAAGEQLVTVLAGLHEQGLVPDGVPALRGRPRQCPHDHPRLPLVRLLGLHVDRSWPAGDWLATGEAVDRVRATWRAAHPLADWLDRHVGRRAEPLVAVRTGPGPAGKPSGAPAGTDTPGTAEHHPTHSSFLGGVDTV
jgi:uncharacterized protein (DUF2461 family)